MKRVLFASLLLGLVGCGPSASGLVRPVDADSDELGIADGALTSTSAATTWFPLAEGNVWTFESSSDTRSLTLGSVHDGLGKLEGLFPSPLWVGTSASAPNTLFAWSETQHAWLPFLRFGYAHTSWTFGEGACQTQTLERAATGTTVNAKAGSFSDTRVIGAELVTQPNVRCEAPAFDELTLAAHTGPVAFRTGRGARYSLASALVNGSRLPAGDGAVAAALSLDQASYANTPNTLGCVSAPCPSNSATALMALTFTITNNTRSTLTWKAPTSCQFDVELASATGSAVKRLSDGRACVQGYTTLTLSPGEARALTAELKLEDRAGLQLDGQYTATARLLGSGGPAASASADFTVAIRR